MREIVQEGAPVLRETAEPVPEALFGSGELSRIVSDMAEALDAQPEGVALAAPQIAVPYRLFVVRADRTTNKQKPTDNQPPASSEPDIQVYINPKITKSSRKRKEADEGCLSVHHVYGTTSRHERVTLSARREDGTAFTRGAAGLLAQIFQHEVDHLDGILFTDHAKKLVHIEPAHADA